MKYIAKLQNDTVWTERVIYSDVIAWMKTHETMGWKRKLADMDFFHSLLRLQARNLVLAATMRTGKTLVFIENVDEILMHGASHRKADRRFSPSH